MKSVSVGAAFVLGVVAAACSTTSTDSRPAAPPPGYRYTPQMMPPPPPRTAYVPPPPRQSYVATAAAPYIASFNEPVNIAQIQAIAGRNPKACGFLQVAPGQWKRVDCHVYAPSTTAVAKFSPRKMMAVEAHTTQWQPFALVAAQFQQMLTQGFSKGIFQGAGSAKSPNGQAAPVVVTAPAPGTIDHRMLGLEGPVKDQGPVGACTAFSLSTVVDNAAIRAGKMLPNNGQQAASANHVWAAYGYPEMGRAADANKGRAIAPMTLWGQSFSEECEIANPVIGDCGSAVTPPVVAGTWRSDPPLVAKSQRADAGGAYRISDIQKLNLPVTTDQLVQILATGSDIWVAFRIDGAAWSSTQGSNPVIPNWTQDNGGHAVTMAGYRDSPSGKQFLIHNNWGSSWADGGYAWLNEAMVPKFLEYAYQVSLTDGVAPSKVTDNDCGSDQLIDIFSGLCSAICPDNSRPPCNAIPGLPGWPPAQPAPGQSGQPAPPTIPGFPAGIPTAFPTALPQIPGLPQFAPPPAAGSK